MVPVTANRSRLSHRPGAVLKASALVLSIGATVLSGFASTIALAIGVCGVAGLVVGLTGRRRAIAGLGALAVFGGVLVAGIAGLPARWLLPSVAAVVLAWVFGIGAFSIESELGGGAVERSELLHVATATSAGTVTVVVAYVGFQTLEFGESVVGVILLVVAVAALGIALRD